MRWSTPLQSGLATDGLLATNPTANGVTLNENYASVM